MAGDRPGDRLGDRPGDRLGDRPGDRLGTGPGARGQARGLSEPVQMLAGHVADLAAGSLGADYFLTACCSSARAARRMFISP